MARFRIITLGRPREEWIRTGFEHYKKLVSKFAEIELVALKSEKIKDESLRQIILQKESEAVLSRINPGNYHIALDERGKILSSEDFAKALDRRFQSGINAIDFIIGSTLGFHDIIREKADLLISFSKMTFPHELALVMLSEQLYRAMSILRGGKYHK